MTCAKHNDFAKLVEWGIPQDYKIGGLTIRCRGEMTPLRKRILAAQIADERKALAGYVRIGSASGNSGWYAASKPNAEQAKDRYIAWCKKHRRDPIPGMNWQPSVTVEVGVFKAELRGDGLAAIERIMDKCRDRPNRPAPQERIAA